MPGQFMFVHVTLFLENVRPVFSAHLLDELNIFGIDQYIFQAVVIPIGKGPLSSRKVWEVLGSSLSSRYYS